MRKTLTALMVAGALASAMTTTVASAAPPSGKAVKAHSFPVPGEGTGKGQGTENGNGWGVGGTPPASPH